ncbi:MAG: hypothetical protein QOJ54_2315 [Aliidongia sp.]|nr:hypothetical protein [Aliidongia sp.]
MTKLIELSRITSRHIGVAAEAIAAAQFARVGFDISVQYGANQPEYDLAVIRDDMMLKVSVKGSQDGGWGLSQGFLSNADYHKAADEWLAGHGERTALCLIQFEGIDLAQMPRIYLALASEVAGMLKASRGGHGDTVIRERKEWGRGIASGSMDEIPPLWRFSKSRVESLLVATTTIALMK